MNPQRVLFRTKAGAFQISSKPSSLNSVLNAGYNTAEASPANGIMVNEHSFFSHTQEVIVMVFATLFTTYPHGKFLKTDPRNPKGSCDVVEFGNAYAKSWGRSVFSQPKAGA